MKLLFCGSLLVVLGVIASAAIDWAIESVVSPTHRATPVEPVLRFVNTGREHGGTSRSKAIVWQTSTALEDCAYVIDRRKRDEGRQLAELMRSEVEFPLSRDDESPCNPFQLGEVDGGTAVEILDDCGTMAKIRILSGSLRGRQGCIEPERLSVSGD